MPTDQTRGRPQRGRPRPALRGAQEWGRWADEDEAARAEPQTEQHRIHAARLVRDGVEDQPRPPTCAAAVGETQFPANHHMLASGDALRLRTASRGTRRAATTSDPGQASADDIDALSHMWAGPDVQTEGPQRPSVSTGATAQHRHDVRRPRGPWGCLLEIPRLQGVGFLDAETAITLRDLEAAESASRYV